MLLALYCLPARGEKLTITSLIYSADVPQTTGHRWQKVLHEEGLIERGPQGGVDQRRQVVRLTARGRALMDQYLTKLFYFDTPVPPYPDDAGG
jgi:predicted transcriptional regulator